MSGCYYLLLLGAQTCHNDYSDMIAQIAGADFRRGMLQGLQAPYVRWAVDWGRTAGAG
jgi:hypothetical protein